MFYMNQNAPVHHINLDDFSRIHSDLACDPECIIIDVRTDKERKELSIQNTKHIPLDRLKEHLEEIKKYKQVYCHCAHGRRAEMAAKLLASQKISCTYLLADIEDWESAGLPTCSFS